MEKSFVDDVVWDWEPMKLLLASNSNRLFLHTKQYHFQCSSKRTRKEDLKRLPKLQNKCVRLICQIPRSDHITPSLEQLHWLPISDRIIHKTVPHVFKSLHGLSPLYINSCLKIRSRPSSVSTRSINHIFLEAPRSKKLAGERAFCVSAPKL